MSSDAPGPDGTNGGTFESLNGSPVLSPYPTIS